MGAKLRFERRTIDNPFELRPQASVSASTRAGESIKIRLDREPE
jgi:hypothetical protein